MVADWIPIKQACEILNIDDSRIYNNEKYMKYYKNENKKRNNARFNIKGFLAERDLEDELQAKIGLFVEWMIHEKNITYAQIASLVANHSKYTEKATKNTLYNGSMSLSLSRTLGLIYWKLYPQLILEFDDYYDFSKVSNRLVKILPKFQLF